MVPMFRPNLKEPISYLDGNFSSFGYELVDIGFSTSS
ncbi:hypothetical protein E1A91_D07G212600v1 [Gossypium mustelinum]|uniref:Uncharacterized protein n=1 Tax=Gossypium mustelinum TaxID=34275 RepID=A0A5D2UEQ0_GOSMU|nr:hypothetical protein E1A91_D07G212600v1 [Gossypium mustelinum]